MRLRGVSLLLALVILIAVTIVIASAVVLLYFYYAHFMLTKTEALIILLPKSRVVCLNSTYVNVELYIQNRGSAPSKIYLIVINGLLKYKPPEPVTVQANNYTVVVFNATVINGTSCVPGALYSVYVYTVNGYKYIGAVKSTAS